MKGRMLKNLKTLANQRLIITSMAALCCLTLHAQNNIRFEADFEITQKASIGKELQRKQVAYSVLNNLKMANDYRKRLLAAMKKLNEPGAMGNELETEIRRLGIQMRESRANGTFTARVEPGKAALVIGDDGVVTIEIKEGQLKYQATIAGQAAIQLQEVVKTEKRKKRKFRQVPTTDTGAEIKFNVNAHLEPGETNSRSRMIIQPVVVDCQTDDTVDYLTPFVIEGNDYHQLQNRRMAYDYFQNDSLARGYVHSMQLYDDRELDFDRDVIYRKPDRNKSYKCTYFVVLEDYTHKYFDNGGLGTGSCLSYKPFKFLDFSAALAELPLTEEFHDQAEARTRDVDRKLRLRFHIGTDELTADSLNDIEVERLTREMRSYGSKLQQIKIEATASPDGNFERNRQLAEKRARRAAQLLRERLGRNLDYVRLPAPNIVVHTWEDVAGELEYSDSIKASEIRQIIKERGMNNAWNTIRNLPYYNSVITPILENLRVMKCSYQYELDHVMDADEVLAEYFSNKHEYVSGTKDLSDGDYYNLFANIHDAKELDTLTLVAYRHVTRQPSYELLRFSAYVANRMALMNMRNSVYDSNVLRPFVDYSMGINVMDNNYKIRKNRREILINQAITYFQEANNDTAQAIIDWLGEGQTDPQTQRMMKYIDFLRLFNAQRTAEEEQRFQKASEFVMAAAPDNRAILYTELHLKSAAEAEELVDRMDDKNPKKWYLKAIIWAELADRALQNRNSDSESDEVPEYLAFFQHSFDMMPQYKRLYFNEGNISDETRKAHPYRKKDIPAYRALFRQLYDSGAKLTDRMSNNQYDKEVTQ